MDARPAQPNQAPSVAALFGLPLRPKGRLGFSWSSPSVSRCDTEEPYGVEMPPILNQTANTHQFTGHERDLATGLDYAHYRYYGSSMGRFMKPDNIPGNLANPQSWNLYSYVHGNPVNFNDPTGHMVGIAWRSYYAAVGHHMVANDLGGGLNLQGHPWD